MLQSNSSIVIYQDKNIVKENGRRITLKEVIFLHPKGEKINIGNRYFLFNTDAVSAEEYELTSFNYGTSEFKFKKIGVGVIITLDFETTNYIDDDCR